MLTRSGRPVVYHAAETALKPPDAPVTSSCELGATHNAALRAGKPLSTPQRAERREGRQRRYIASGHDHPQQASRRAPRGRDGPTPVRRSGHQLMRARGRTQRCPPSERASQRAAARRSAQVAARVARGVTAAPTYLPSDHSEGVLPRSTRQGRPLRPPGALAVSLCEPQAAPNATPRAEEPHSTPQRAEWREGRQRRYDGSDGAHSQRASCRAQRGRDGPKTVRRFGHLLVRARGRA